MSSTLIVANVAGLQQLVAKKTVETGFPCIIYDFAQLLLQEHES